MCTYRFTLALVVVLLCWVETARSETPDESLESKLDLKPLATINLLDTTPAPPLGILRMQSHVFFKTMESKQWVWQPPPSPEPVKSKRRTRNPQPMESLLPEKPIDPAIYFNAISSRIELSEVLAKRFLDSQSGLRFHAKVASPNGNLFLGKIENAPTLIGRQYVRGVLMDQYVMKFAQLKMYETRPDYIELRLFHRMFQKEALPPGTPANVKPREFTQTQQVCPTLILESKSSLKSLATVPATQSNADAPAAEKSKLEAGSVTVPVGTQPLSSEPKGVDTSSIHEGDYRPAGGEVVRFERRGDHVSFDQSIELGSAVTIEAIVKPVGPWVHGTVVNADGTVLAMDATADPVVIEDYNPNRLRALVPIQASVWHHIALVRNGTQWRFFSNGKLTGQKVDARLRSDGQQLVISRADGKMPFLGDLREVRISSNARYNDGFDPPSTLTHDPQTIVLLNAEDAQGNRWPGRGNGDYVGELHGAYPAVAADLAGSDESSTSDSMTSHATFEVITSTQLKPLKKGTRVFSNRPGQIFTTNPPDRFRNWSFTQHGCFEPPTYEIDVQRPGLVFIASSSATDAARTAMIRALLADGWTQIDGPSELLDGNQEGTAVESPWPIFSKQFNNGRATLPVADRRCGTVILVPPTDFIP